jgi:acetyl esterase/lipase
LKTTFGEDFSWGLNDEEISAPDFTFHDPNAPINDLVIGEVRRARCYAFLAPKPNGRAALVLAGGGYTQLMIGKEGVEVARWLNSLGVHAFVLVHRFPSARFTDGERSGAQAPVDDAIEAMRQIRARPDDFGIRANAVGVVGLSSGGHLAASLVAQYPFEWRAPGSPLASVSHRPDFMVVGYAPISTNATGRTVIPNKPPLPPQEKQALYEAMQPDLQLRDSPPPAFIVYAANDAVVPVENAYRLHKAWTAKGGLAELHVFADAPHGFALREPELPVGQWPPLCARWLASL